MSPPWLWFASEWRGCRFLTASGYQGDDKQLLSAERITVKYRLQEMPQSAAVHSIRATEKQHLCFCAASFLSPAGVKQAAFV